MRAIAVLLGALVVTVGVELTTGPVWPELAGDAAAGAALLGAGGLTALHKDGRRVGVLLLIAGASWLVGTAVGALAALHRGPLLHALLSAPDGRLRSRLARVAVAAAYVSGAVAELANAQLITLAVAVLAFASARQAQRDPALRRPRLTAEVTFLCAALIIGVVASLGDGSLDPVASWAYYAATTAAAVAVPAHFAWSRWTGAAATGLVANLGELEGTDGLRDRLAHALDDPSLAVGYRLGREEAYVDARGLPVLLPTSSSGRTVTEVREVDEVVAVLVHDSAVLQDPSLRKAVAAATRLAVANTQLQAQIAARAREVAASRRRLLEVADTQRRRLEAELRSSAGRRLDTVAERLTSLDDERVAPIAAELGLARADLARLARGLHPAALTRAGLAAALQELVTASPQTIALDVTPARYLAPVEAAAYFVCAEALANSAKHARSRRVSVEIAANRTTLRVKVIDDGCGGASASGSGLLGLRDRVEALEGRLQIESPAGGGTQIVAELPLR